MIMSKAEEIISKHNNVEWNGNGDPLFDYEQVLSAMKEIADKSFEAGRDFQYAVGNPPNKEQFLTQLFD